jgi:hypothetical protein
MKTQYLLALGFLAAFTPAQASITVIDPNYSTSTYFTHGNSDTVQSYDWDASNNLFYSTTTASFNFGGLYKAGTGQVVAGSSDFASTSVTRIGNYVYYNTSDFSNQKIYNYNTVTNTASGAAISTTPNYGLYTNNGQLFITGSVSFGTNHIYTSTLDSNGDLVSDPAIDLGVTSGGSGPLAFDSDGNLYYAPGFSDPSIYKFSAADLANAIADPTGDPLSITGNLWLNYSSLYSSYSGGTSMAFDENGDLMLTLTNFVDPSLLVKFGIDDLTGAYNSNANTILEDSGILGELRFHDGEIYVSSGNQIINVSAVPEPSTYALLFLGLSVVVIATRRKLAKA